MSLHRTDFAPLAGPYIRRSKAQRLARFVARLLRYLAGPHP